MAHSTVTVSLTCLFLAAGASAIGDAWAQREAFTQGWPRAFFFRASEGLARSQRHSFEAWERAVLPLNGIMGKALDEEIPGTSGPNIDFFTRFKANHPDKLVLLHYNGNARDPRDGIEEFFAGHWIYYNGCRITRDLPAEDAESVVHVEDAGLFKTNMGRYGDKKEDIGICVLGPDGRPDWSVSEQVELVAVDLTARTLRVKRGAFGTQPRNFAASKTYIAAHVTEGPWGQRNNIMWFYNYSLACPKDARGRTCADVLLDDLAAHFLPGGDLASFDGLEFDVMTWTRAPASGRIGQRGHDCDADGIADYGIFDGRNTYGIGVYDFCRRLRERLGDDKLIMADGAGPNHQRSFGVLNGIESEGWPHLSDWEIVDWSGGLNRHNFWRENAYLPAFSYVNHKFIRAGKPIQVPMNISRLVLASCLFTDSAITYSLQPARDEGQLIGVYDELVMGAEGKTNWLGMPVGEPHRLGLESPDLLRGEGAKLSPAFLGRWTSPNTSLAAVEGTLRVTARDVGASPLLFTLRDVDVPEGDLLLRMRIQADTMEGYPADIARLVWVACLSAGELITPRLPSTGMAIRGGDEGPIDATTGAVVDYRDPGTVAGESHRSYYIHPPYRGVTGYAFWDTEATLPDADCRLEFHIALSDTARATSDGVTFKVLLRDGDTEHEVFSHHHTQRAWAQHSADLSRWKGRTVRLRFVSDVGPDDNSVADQSFWGDVAVVRTDRQIRPRADMSYTPGRIMTWANPRPFDATFYFRDRGPDTVDLEFEMEGVEPVTITDMSLHAAADAICREYEHGAVLANPSMRPYTFDMAQLFPGRRFRRLNGSPKQDPTTNDGSAVGDSLTLGPRDGIFLVKQ